MTSTTEENYLKAIYALADDRGKVNLSDLSALLEVSKPSVNSMVKNLQKKDLLHYEKYKPLSLTEKGRIKAALIIRKHRLTEMFLVEKMRFGWEEVHEIAEQVEHINSPAFFDRMDKILEYPTVDPHGSPIPDKNGNIIQPRYKKLSEFKQGKRLRLVGLNNSTKEFLEFLDSRQISLQIEIKVDSVEPFDGSMVISYENQKSVSLSQKACERLLVEEVK